MVIRRRFQAVLQARGSDSIFKIVETNDFKQLAHIALAFRPGSDTAIKQANSYPFLSTWSSPVLDTCAEIMHGCAEHHLHNSPENFQRLTGQ